MVARAICCGTRSGADRVLPDQRAVREARLGFRFSPDKTGEFFAPLAAIRRKWLHGILKDGLPTDPAPARATFAPSTRPIILTKVSSAEVKAKLRTGVIPLELPLGVAYFSC
jgi:hypothetical protein